MLYPSCSSWPMLLLRLLTALGRAGFGTQQAFSPRYLFHSGSLAVGLLAAFNAWRIVGARRRGGAIRHARRAIAVIFFACCLPQLAAWLAFFPNHENRPGADFAHGANAGTLSGEPSRGQGLSMAESARLLASLKARGLYDPSNFDGWLLEALKSPPPKRRAGPARPQGTVGGRAHGLGIIPVRTPRRTACWSAKESVRRTQAWLMLAVALGTTKPGSNRAASFGLAVSWKFRWSGPASFRHRGFCRDERNRACIR